MRKYQIRINYGMHWFNVEGKNMDDVEERYCRRINNLFYMNNKPITDVVVRSLIGAGKLSTWEDIMDSVAFAWYAEAEEQKYWDAKHAFYEV